MSLNDVPPHLLLAFAGCCLLLVATASLRPRPLGLRGERMPRLVLLCLWTITFAGVVALVSDDTDSVSQFLGAARALPAVGWARMRLDSGAVSSLPVMILLIIISGGSISVQYVVSTFSTRKRGLKLDRILPATGRAERTVRTVAAAVGGGAEEVLFRQILPALAYSRGVGLGMAIVAPYVVFVALHARQKTIGLLNAAAVGAALTAVFLASGQLVWAIALHVTANVIAGSVVPEIYKARDRRIARQAIAAWEEAT